jgi:ABC-type sugar transport system ATPase subunit
MLAVEVKNVSKRFDRTLALDGVSLEFRGGELFALLGPNGAGKTTLAHILCTIHLPGEGQAKIAGFDVITQAVLARQQLGVAFLGTRVFLLQQWAGDGRNDQEPYRESGAGRGCGFQGGGGIGGFSLNRPL